MFTEFLIIFDAGNELSVPKLLEKVVREAFLGQKVPFLGGWRASAPLKTHFECPKMIYMHPRMVFWQFWAPIHDFEDKILLRGDP